MTTTVTLDQSTTITSVVRLTETAIVKGILSLSIQNNDGTNNGPAAITFANKGVVSSAVVSTIYSTSTSTSTAAASSSATKTSSSHTALNTLFQQSSDSTTSNIGLIIGLPIAIVGSLLIVVGLYFYIKQRKVQSQYPSQNTSPTEKFSYSISPITKNMNFPYKSNTTLELKDSNKGHHYSNSFAYSTDTLMQPPKSQSHYPSPNYLKSQSELSLKELPKRNSRWSLGSPLSKWFVKPTTDQQHQSIRSSLSTGAPFSPILALREFKLKRSVNKELLTNPTPVQPQVPELIYPPSSNLKHSFNKSWDSSIHSLQSDKTMAKQQVVRSSNIVPPTAPTLQSIPKQKKINKPLPTINPSSSSLSSSSSSSSLKGFESKISTTRQNPTTPKVDFSKYNNPSIYKVIKSYNKNLSDELNMRRGEYVKILSRHTDGWCLVEKVDKLGLSLIISNPEHFESERYLNDSRGVIPKICLQKYISS